MFSIFTKLKLKRLNFRLRMVRTSDDYGQEYTAYTLYNKSIFAYEILVPTNYKMKVIRENKSYVLKLTCNDNIFKITKLDKHPGCIENSEEAIRALKQIAARSHEVKIYLSGGNKYVYQVLYFYNFTNNNMNTCELCFKLIDDHACGRLNLLKEFY